MPDLDVDAARKAGVAVPPDSVDEYLEAADQLRPGFVRTVDATDPSVGWTVQHTLADREGLEGDDAKPQGYVEPGDTLPGQVYMPWQLPDPAAAIEAGLTPQKIPTHLVTDNPEHIQGPEASELAIEEHRRALRSSVLRHATGESYAGVDAQSGSATTVVMGESNPGAESDAVAAQNKRGSGGKVDAAQKSQSSAASNAESGEQPAG